MNFAIIGASGNVGRKTIEILEKSKISFKDILSPGKKEVSTSEMGDAIIAKLK